MPERLTVGPTWLIPLVELALLVPLLLTAPHWHAAQGRNWQRWAIISLFGLLNAANLVSLALLIVTLLSGEHATPATLIGEAGKIWLTNVVIFGFWYWELDRGGPRARHWLEPHPRTSCSRR